MAQDERHRREWVMNGGSPQDYFFFTTAQRHSGRKPAGRTVNSLTPGRRALDGDEIDRAARTLVVENADRQPPRSPGQCVEIGSAIVKQRTVGVIIMTVDNVEVGEAFRISLGIALPKHRPFALAIERIFGINPRVHIETVGIDMKQPQPIKPVGPPAPRSAQPQPEQPVPSYDDPSLYADQVPEPRRIIRVTPKVSR